MNDGWVEWQAEDSEAGAALIGGRVAHASWPLLRFTLRSVLLDPHRRAGGGTVAWRWRGPRRAPAPDDAALADVRRRLGDALADLVADAESSARAGGGSGNGELHGGMAVILRGFVRLSDRRLAAHVVRTDGGWMIRSWGFDSPARASVMEDQSEEAGDDAADGAPNPRPTREPSSARRTQRRFAVWLFALVLLGVALLAAIWLMRRDRGTAPATAGAVHPGEATTLAKARNGPQTAGSGATSSNLSARWGAGAGAPLTSHADLAGRTSVDRSQKVAPKQGDFSRGPAPSGRQPPESGQRAVKTPRVTNLIEVAAVVQEEPTARRLATVPPVSKDEKTDPISGDDAAGGIGGGASGSASGGAASVATTAGPNRNSPASPQTSASAGSLTKLGKRTSASSGHPQSDAATDQSPRSPADAASRPDAKPSAPGRPAHPSAAAGSAAGSSASDAVSQGDGDAERSPKVGPDRDQAVPNQAADELPANQAETWGHKWAKPNSVDDLKPKAAGRTSDQSGTTPADAESTDAIDKKNPAAVDDADEKDKDDSIDGRMHATDSPVTSDADPAGKSHHLRFHLGPWRVVQVRDVVLPTWPGEGDSRQVIAAARARALAKAGLAKPPALRDPSTRTGWVLQLALGDRRIGEPVWVTDNRAVTVVATRDRAELSWAGDMPVSDVVARLQSAAGRELARVVIEVAKREVDVSMARGVVAVAPQFAVMRPAAMVTGGLAWRSLPDARQANGWETSTDAQETGVICRGADGAAFGLGRTTVAWMHEASGWALTRTIVGEETTTSSSP